MFESTSANNLQQNTHAKKERLHNFFFHEIQQKLLIDGDLASIYACFTPKALYLSNYTSNIISNDFRGVGVTLLKDTQLLMNTGCHEGQSYDCSDYIMLCLTSRSPHPVCASTETQEEDVCTIKGLNL